MIVEMDEIVNEIICILEGLWLMAVDALGFEDREEVFRHGGLYRIERFTDRKVAPLSIRNRPILPFSMVVPFQKSIVCPFLLFEDMVLAYL